MSREPASADALLADARWLRALARRLVKGADEAEELVQEARLVALGRTDGAGRAWLAEILANLARMRWRSERARAARERAVARPERLESAAEVVERAEAQRVLVSHVLALDEPYRATLLWHYFDGLSAAEIARRAGVPSSTVRTRIERGLAALRGRMERERGSTWAVLLVPLARRVPAGWGTGVLAMKLGTVVAGVVALAAFVWWLGPLRTRTGVHGPGEPGGVELAATPEAPVVLANVREPLAPAEDERAAPEAELTGRVVTTGGDPIAGARVRAVRPLARQWPIGVGEREVLEDLETAVIAATTDADGAFRLDVERDQVLDLEVAADDYAGERRLDVHGGEEVEIVLGRAACIQGTITRRSGEVAGGVRVEATAGVIGVPGRRTHRMQTDAAGRYRLDGLAPDFFKVWASKSESRSLVLTEGEVHVLDLVLDDPFVVQGRVTDGRTEAPLANAKVWVRMREESAVHTDASGRYRIAVERRALANETLHAAAPGYGDFERELTDVPEGGDELDFFLLPGRTARGRVVDAHGAPVAGAYVSASGLSREAAITRWDGRSTRTGSDGRFALAELRVDLRHTLLVRADGHASAAFDFPEREWSETALDLGDLPLDPPATLAGRVVDLEGRELPGMWVFAFVEPRERDRLGPVDGGLGYLAGFGEREPQSRVDAHGRFLFTGIPAGRVLLKADAKGWAHSGEIELDVAPGERKTDLVITVDPGHSISGVVVDGEGRPLPGITVDACDAEGGRIIYDLAREDGSFALHGLPAGIVGIRTSSGLYHGGLVAERYLRDVPVDSRDVRLVVERAVEQRVRVVDRLGAQLAGAYVGITDGDGSVPSMAPSDREGRISVTVPGTSTFDLMAFANRRFDPEADFFDALFLDEDGKWIDEMTGTARGLVASDDEVVIVIDGLP